MSNNFYSVCSRNLAGLNLEHNKSGIICLEQICSKQHLRQTLLAYKKVPIYQVKEK